MTDTPLRPLTPAELPLVLLAVVAHPDAAFREHLGLRLRSAIEQDGPRYTARNLRTFFRRQDRRCRAGMRLAPQLRDLAVLAAQIAFSGEPKVATSALLIAPGEGSLKDGYVVKSSLEVISLARCALTRHRLHRRQAEFGDLARFLPEMARARLARFRRRESGVRVACRVANRLELELTDETPWSAGIDLMRPAHLLPVRPDCVGFTQRWRGKTLKMWPETPEATLRFSAWLAEGKSLLLEHGYATNRDRRKIVVRLRDFDDRCVELPAITGTSHGEPWLVRFPSPRMSLETDDCLAIARWAYPLNDWMNDDLVEKLI